MNSKKDKLTEAQKALFFPYVDKLMENSAMVLGNEIKRMLMFQFSMGPYMAMQVQREYRREQWRQHDQRNGSAPKNPQGSGISPKIPRTKSVSGCLR